jgi:tripeptide aminopeptidase
MGYAADMGPRPGVRSWPLLRAVLRSLCLGSICLSAICLASQNPSARELMAEPAIRAALEAARHNEPDLIEQQVRLCQIPAPSFQESARGQEVERLFQTFGLHNVHRDKAGNVIGTRPGTSAQPNVVLAAHLDTVFPRGTPVTVTRDGPVLKGPGIGDDCRGLAVMLGVIQALREAKVQTPGTITFVADTGEEGLGDLRGMKALFGPDLKGHISKFVSIDGGGMAVTDIGVGSYRYRVTFKGPGGHSFANFGNANPIQAMGRAIAKIDEIHVPESPRTTFNVGRVGGGTSVNSIPYECWMEVDMRSVGRTQLEQLRRDVDAAVREAVEEENRRWGHRGDVSVSFELVGNRPAGSTADNSAIVQAALEISGLLGARARLGEGSTDANLPMSLGIPAITIGGGGRGYGVHTPEESWDSTDSYIGTQRTLLLIVALAR